MWGTVENLGRGPVGQVVNLRADFPIGSRILGPESRSPASHLSFSRALRSLVLHYLVKSGKISVTMRLTVTLLCVAIFPLAAERQLPPASDVKIDFDKDVKPLLSEKCYSCHGSKVQQSGLRLDKRQNALRGGDYGPVIIAGKSAESKLIFRVVDGDGGLQMPPTGALSKEDIGILRAWIDQGADFGRVEVKEEVPKKAINPKLKVLISAVRAQDTQSVEKILKSDPALLKLTDQGGSTALHHAAGFGTVAIMKMLIDHGADVNAKNDRNSTPLHWAVADEAKTRLLLDSGANINARQADGRTPLYNMIGMENHNAVARLLLDRGADPNIPTANGNTNLMVAAGRGDVEALKLLIAHGAKVDARNGAGGTALINSALGRNEAVRLLLAQGADVNAATKRKVTALSNAAMQGSEEIVRLLLDRGAKVNVQDDRGYSPLMYAAYAETLSAGVVKLLLAKGADTSFTGEGETAKTLAAKRGDSEVARLLGVSEEERKRGGVAEAPAASPQQRPVALAVTQALQVLEKQSHNFVRISGCISCHNQMLPSASVALARQRGIPAPPNIASLSREFREVSAERAMDLTLNAVNSLGYEMFDLGMNRAEPDEYTDSIVRYILSMQTAGGYWKTAGNRPPITSDDFQTTGFAIYSLKQYARGPLLPEANKSIARAAQWLESATPGTTQERAFHLLGLNWAHASKQAQQRATSQLTANQRADGGWSQLPSMASDAYATGEALYALESAGQLAASDLAYQKAIRYLLRTQAADGSWHVKTRSLTVQPYFESGFPYGDDQWISAAGTAYSAMALSLSVESKPLTRGRDRLSASR
jgi:ankyrin repeat protein